MGHDYTPTQRAEMHEAFVSAKQRMWISASDRGKYSSYICYSLPPTISAECMRNCLDLIKSRLGRFSNSIKPAYDHDVDSWLFHVAKIPSEQLTYNNVQAYRHRWLDSLIEEFSKEQK